MNMNEIWGRAQWAGWQARERMTIAVQSAAPLFRVILIALAAFVVGYGLAWWSTEAEVNASWRSKIVAASSAVREAAAAGNAEVQLTDEEIIKRLGETDEQLKSYEDALEAALASTTEFAGCPALHPQCYRLRDR